MQNQRNGKHPAYVSCNESLLSLSLLKWVLPLDGRVRLLRCVPCVQDLAEDVVEDDLRVGLSQAH